MDLIDEQEHVAGLHDLLQHPLDTLFKFTTVLGSRDHAGQVQRDHALPLDRLRHVAGHDQLGETFHHGSLADAGLTDQTGVVLGSSGKDLHHPLHLHGPADDRIQFSRPCELRQIPGILVESRRAAVLGRASRMALHPARGLLAGGTAVLSHGTQDIHVDLLDVDAHGVEDLAGHTGLLPQDRDQDVLRADLGRLEALRLRMAVVKSPSGHRRVLRLVLDRHVLLRRDQTVHQLQDPFLSHLVFFQDSRGNAASLAHQPQEKMLGPDVVVMDVPRRLVGEPDRVPCLFGKIIRHLRQNLL